MAINDIRFDRAEYGAAAPEPCTWCGRGLEGEFYRANAKQICGLCALKAKAFLRERRGANFYRAIGVGVLAAVGSSLIYLGVIHFVLAAGGFGMGFGAIGVGYAIGRAMRWGGRGGGGRRYQVGALVLTYLAISISLAVELHGAGDMPVWGFPLLSLVPIADLFFGRFQEGMFQLLIVSIGARWAWALLRSHPPLRITGPEMLTVDRSPVDVGD